MNLKNEDHESSGHGLQACLQQGWTWLDDRASLALVVGVTAVLGALAVGGHALLGSLACKPEPAEEAP